MKGFGKERQEIVWRSQNVNNGNYIFSGAGDLGGLGRLLTKAFGLNIGSEIPWDLLHQPAGKLVLWVRRAHARFSTFRESKLCFTVYVPCCAIDRHYVLIAIR